MWVMYQIQLPTKKSLLVLNPTSGSMNEIWDMDDFHVKE